MSLRGILRLLFWIRVNPGFRIRRLGLSFKTFPEQGKKETAETISCALLGAIFCIITLLNVVWSMLLTLLKLRGMMVK